MAPICATVATIIISKKEKLNFLQSAVPEAELIHLFIKGLSPVFQPIQVHFAIPGTLPGNFMDVVAVVRRFSTNPVVAAELCKYKNVDKNADSALFLNASLKNNRETDK